MNKNRIKNQLKKNCLRFVTWFLVFWFSTDFLSFFKPLFDIHRYLRPFPFRQTKFIWLIQGSFFVSFLICNIRARNSPSNWLLFLEKFVLEKSWKKLESKLDFFYKPLTHCVRLVITFNGIIIQLFYYTKSQYFYSINYYCT